MSRSATALCLTLATITIVLSGSVLTDDVRLECDEPKSFAIELDDDKKFVIVHDAEINVTYNGDELAVYEYPGTDDVNILINNTIVSFSGHILADNEEVTSDSRVTKIFNSKIAGFAKLSKNNGYTLTDCHLYLSRNHNEEVLNVPKKIQHEIIHEAVSCVKSSFVTSLKRITETNFRRARKHPYDFGTISVVTGDLVYLRAKIFESRAKPKINPKEIKQLFANLTKAENTNEVDGSAIQKAANEIVDLAVAGLVAMMREENEGRIEIPDLEQNFTTGSSWWSTTGNFDAYNGTFEDLTTLSRFKDVGLERDGKKFSAACNFSLSLSNMNYRNYALRYGIVNVHGKISASIDGIVIEANGSVDFAQRPCRAVLVDTRVAKMGKIKVIITGLGPLNKLLSLIVTSITKKWQDEIVVQIEKQLRNIVARHMHVFECERYRLDL